MRLMSLLIWGLALLLNSAAANAETVEAANLRGLKSFDILVEDLSDEAARCGVTKNKLDTELLFILGQSGMQLVPRGIDGYVYLQVTVIEGCAAGYSLQVHTLVTVEKTQRKVVVATIWNQGGIRSGGNPSVDTLAAVSELAKLLVVDWNSVNK